MSNGGRRRGRTGSTYRARGAPSVDLQICAYPGGPALSGLRLRLASGQVLNAVQGTFRVPVSAELSEVVLLGPNDEAFASWLLGARTGFPAFDSFAGLYARLNQLGYNAGVEQDEPEASLERAVLSFQADQGLRLEGVTRQLDVRDRDAQVRPIVRASTAEHLRDAALELVAPAPPLEDPDAPQRGIVGDGFVATHVYRAIRMVLVRIERSEQASYSVRFTVPGGDEVNGPDVSCPWVEDRGSQHSGTHHGPLISVMEHEENRTYKLDIVREALNTDAPLHVVSLYSSSVSVRSGALEGNLRETLEIEVSSQQSYPSTDAWQRIVDLEVRLGSTMGPVIHTLRVLVLRPVKVPVAVINITHEGGGSWSGGRRNTRATLARCNRLLEPAGIVLDGTPPRGDEQGRDVCLDTRFDDFNYDREHPTPAGLSGAALAEWQREHDPNIRMLQQKHHPDRLNIYVFHAHHALLERSDRERTTGVLAKGYWKRIFREHYPEQPQACFVICSQDAFEYSDAIPLTLAHEICHVLGLRHVDDGRWRRVTTCALRRLMYWASAPPTRMPDWHPYHDRNAHAEPMLTIKDLAHERDDEVATLRRNAGSGYAFDGLRLDSQT